MPFSMTGYAQVSHESDELSLSITLRSVNHRSLDLKLRIPPDLEPLEGLIRKAVKRSVRRGQLQMSVSLRWSGAAAVVSINRPLVDAYLKTYRELATAHGILAEPDLNVILRVPGALTYETDPSDERRRLLLEAALEDCLSQATAELNRIRQLEAAGIVEQIKQRAKSIGDDVRELETVRLDTIPLFQERVRERLGELMDGIDPDPQRILQEAAVLADRADISEELQRLSAHVGRLKQMLEQDDDLGKPIDFLAQEMNRETNTLLSKTTPLGRAGLAVTEVGLRLKAEIEKIREQTQNLE